MRRLLLSICAAALAAVALPAPAAAQKLAVERHTLDNGMTVLTHEDHSIPMISLYVFYRVGSRNERPGITGVSHLFEHMMFNGSAKYGPKQFDLVLENAGSGGNGYTNNDFTAYLETFPREALAAVLDLEADRMRSLTINEKNLEQERGIVKEERRVSTDNSPTGRMFEEMMAAAFVAHPYQWPVVGWMGDLDAIRLEEAQRYFDTYYGPNNATLVLTGDFKTEDLLKEVRASFGAVPKRGAPQPVVNSEPLQQGERRLNLVYEASLPAVMLGYKSPAARHADAPALEVLSAILGTGESSRLYRKLVYGQIATETNSSFMAMADPSLFTFYAQAGEKTTAAQCEAAIGEVIRDVKTGGVTADELQKAKNLLRAGMIDNLQTIASKANFIGSFEVQYGDWSALTTILDRYDAVTNDDIKRVAVSYFNDHRKTVVMLVLPEAAKEVANVPKSALALIVLLTTLASPVLARPSTQTIDVPAPAGGVDMPAWSRTVMPNGLVVILMRQDENPLVHARLTLRAGSASDPKGKEGLASLTAELLTAGTTKRSAEQIATDTDFVGGQLSATSDADTTTVTSQFLSRDTTRQFDLLSDVVLRPAFAAAEVDRIRQQRLAEIAALPENSGRYADLQYESVLMAGTPYAHPSVGLKSSVATITRDDVVGFHTSAYAPNNGVLAIVGAFDPATMMSMVQTSFGNWSKRTVPAPSTSEPGKISGRRVVVVDYPNLNQSQVRLGDIGIARNDPDYAAIQVANAVLSFGFSSRLIEEIRVNRSLTYRIASRFNAGVQPGTFVIQTFTKNATTREIIDATLGEVKKFRDGPLTDAEVNRAKNIILARLTQQLETPSGLAGMLTQIEIFGMPKDYVETLAPSIRGLTPATLQPIVRKHFPLDDLVIVVFTTASETKAQLDGLTPAIEMRKAE